MGTSKLNREVAGTHFLRRKHCGHPIKVDSRGFACCPICKLAFNDGVPGDDRADIEIRAVGYTPIDPAVHDMDSSKIKARKEATALKSMCRR